MLDSILDAVTNKVNKIHNVTDVAVTETRKLVKVVTSSEDKIREAGGGAEALHVLLQSAADELADLRGKLKQAEQELEMARFQAMETSEVMDTLEGLAGNAAQFAEPESKKIIVEHDQRLFEQSAGQLNEKDLKKAIGRLSMQRVKLIAKFCEEVLTEEATPPAESSPLPEE